LGAYASLGSRAVGYTAAAIDEVRWGELQRLAHSGDRQGPLPRSSLTCAASVLSPESASLCKKAAELYAGQRIGGLGFVDGFRIAGIDTFIMPGSLAPNEHAQQAVRELRAWVAAERLFEVD
jgi:hypothetical protein